MAVEKTWYTVDVFDKTEWNVAERGERPRDLKGSVLKANGKLYVSNEVLRHLGIRQSTYVVGFKLGRRKLFEFTDRMFEDVEWQASYERRTAKQEKVSDRIWAGLEWLIDNADIIRHLGGVGETQVRVVKGAA